MAQAAWGASSARLTRESFLPFGSCGLCLRRARDPVACAAAGDLFCRECALSDLLAQKKALRRAARARAAEDRGAREGQERRDAEAQAAAVKDFELTQAGLEGAGKRRREEEEDEGKEAAAPEERDPAKKRKFALDAADLARIADADRARARRALDDEKAAARPVLPSYWAPTVTPGSDRRGPLHEVAAAAKTAPVCPASKPGAPHAYSLHALVSVHFDEDGEDDARVCPACRRALSNASRAVLAKPCGHVLCGGCADKFLRPVGDPHDPRAGAARCYVCDADLGDGKPDGDKPAKEGKEGKEGKDKDKIRPGLVPLRSEGTGFSAGGTSEVKKHGVAFQC